jgi:hypothetical protein
VPWPKSIASGHYHTCSLMSDGTVRCWGSLATVTPSTSRVPMSIPGITDAVVIAAADSYTCVVVAGGTVECWGLTTQGDCCDETCTFWGSSPTAIEGLANAVSISYAGQSTCGYEICALQDDGTVECVGHNTNSWQYAGPMPEPVVISGITNPIGIAGMCAVLRDQTVSCWEPGSAVPVAVGGIAGAISTSGTCALLADGTVKCWSGTPPVATTVDGVENAVALASTYDHACVVLSAGAIKCWGKNYDGELGDGSENDSKVPVRVLGIDDAVATTVSAGHSCALLSSGAVKCWGSNRFGELGDGSTADRSTVPVTVQGL